jgi:modulator of FtsH protease HflK
MSIKSLHLQSLWLRARALFSLGDNRWGRGDDNEPPKTPPNQDNNRRPGNAPPDLDQLWRDFNERINALFGRKNNRGGGNRQSGPANSRSSYIAILVLSVILVLGWLGSGIYIVHEGQVGIVLRFGKYVYTTDPGIQWRLPYPFEANETVNMSQVRSIEIGREGAVRQANLNNASMLTREENIVDVTFAVQYRLKDGADFLFNNADAEANVKQAAETAVREIVGRSTMDFVLYAGREQVAQDLAKSIQHILDSYKTGILVTSVTMHNVQPPSQVQAAFDDAVKAGQDRERQKSEAQAYEKDILPRAEGAGDRIIQEAEAYRERIVAQAQGDTSRFEAILAEYNKAPDVTRERMYLETMEQIFDRVSKVLVDNRNGNNLIYLPLDKLGSSKNSAGGFAGENDKKVQTVNSAGKQEQTNAPSMIQNNTDRSRVRDNAGPRERRYDVVSDLLGDNQ